MDIYFKPEYGKLNEALEGGVAETFSFECEFGKAQSLFIKREIDVKIDGNQYYDAVTPYGYGGPVILECTDREKLIEAFSKAYAEYCREERIVDEFVRFHPLAGNALDFKELYNAQYNRHTLAIDLISGDFFTEQFSPNCRNMIRKAAKKGVAVSVDEACERLDDFISLYYATMDKNDATGYYYFTKEYFEGLKAVPDSKLILINAFLEDKIIASAMFMISDEFMHYHLSSTDPEYYSYAANNMILNAAAEYGKEHGLKWLHLGGGLSSSEEDNLFKFKRNFARTERNLKDFYIGKTVFMPEAFEKICEAAGVSDNGFFPPYRAGH